MMQLPNESVLSDTSNIRDNPHDLSISTIDSSPRVEKSKGAQFFGKVNDLAAQRNNIYDKIVMDQRR